MTMEYLAYIKIDMTFLTSLWDLFDFLNVIILFYNI